MAGEASSSRTHAESYYRDDYGMYLPLYKAVMRSDWEITSEILNQDPEASKAILNCNNQTALHVAIDAKKEGLFVNRLVGEMSRDALALRDKNGYTALHLAVFTNNIAAATTLVEKCSELVYIQTNKGDLPINIAARHAPRNMLVYLMSKTNDDAAYSGEAGIRLLCSVIDARFFDVALNLVEKYPHLANTKASSGGAALLRLAHQPSTFLFRDQFKRWEASIYSRILLETTTPGVTDVENPTCCPEVCAGFEGWCKFVVRDPTGYIINVIIDYVPIIKKIYDMKVMDQQATRLLTYLCSHMNPSNDVDASAIFRNAVLIAAREGIYEIMRRVLEAFPIATHVSEDGTGHEILELTILNRQEVVFRLFRHTFADQNHVFDKVDASNNTILHLAAKLAPSHRLEGFSCPVLKLQHELQWFEEVSKFLDPETREHRNSDGKTAMMIFEEEHETLVKQGEDWMRSNAVSQSVISILVATVIVGLAATAPGGNNNETGIPIFSKFLAFKIFSGTVIVGFCSSMLSLAMFLTTTSASYERKKFLHQIPKRLIFSFSTLLLSLVFMILIFVEVVVLYLIGDNLLLFGLAFVASLTLVLCIFPLPHFALVVDATLSTFGGKKLLL